MPEATAMNGKKRGGGLNGPQYVDQILKGPLKQFLDTVEEQEGRDVLAIGAPCCHRRCITLNFIYFSFVAHDHETLHVIYDVKFGHMTVG